MALTRSATTSGGSLDEVTTGITVFHYDEFGNGKQPDQRSVYPTQRNSHWYQSHNQRLNNAAGNRLRCEIDEFPLNSLMESRNFAKQALRASFFFFFFSTATRTAPRATTGKYWAAGYVVSVLNSPRRAPACHLGGAYRHAGASDGRVTAAAGGVIKKYGLTSSSGLARATQPIRTPGAPSPPSPTTDSACWRMIPSS